MAEPKLTEKQVKELATSLPEWSVEDGELVRTYEFPEFLDGIAFVQCIAQSAEELNHHPDIDIRFNAVTVRLTTHDSGGLTALDVKLAQEGDELFAMPAFTGEGEEEQAEDLDDDTEADGEGEDLKEGDVPEATAKLLRGRPIIG